MNIDAEAAIAIGDFLGIDAELWINLHDANQDEQKRVSYSFRQDSKSHESTLRLAFRQ
jgi:plasmid maintenance system antidote protein VapI